MTKIRTRHRVDGYEDLRMEAPTDGAIEEAEIQSTVVCIVGQGCGVRSLAVDRPGQNRCRQWAKWKRQCSFEGYKS
jgi:hypothetical protein